VAKVKERIHILGQTFIVKMAMFPDISGTDSLPISTEPSSNVRKPSHLDTSVREHSTLILLMRRIWWAPNNAGRWDV